MKGGNKFILGNKPREETTKSEIAEAYATILLTGAFFLGLAIGAASYGYSTLAMVFGALMGICMLTGIICLIRA
ncbi:MAG: hypothetical protein BHV69_10155 [Bacteroidales bacterium 52_46]|nr:MAG: hypothetical protein BHV69_10155 [Bacteroidales bacterium 52_46]